MVSLALYFLGPLEIHCGDRKLSKPPTLKSQSLLAYLVLHRDRAQPRERLADMFWGDRPGRKARRSLATALWHIRRCLPDETLILSDSQTVQFNPQADVWLDLEEFESRATRDDVSSLRSAVERYRGEFLAGFYDDWVISERYRLEALFFEALARLMVGHEARGDHQAALAAALRLLSHDPLREDAHRMAMRSYARLGRRSAALEQYERCRDVVLQELGAEPMVETSELYQDILEGGFRVGPLAHLLPVETPAAGPGGRSPLDVIVPARLVGREQELALLDQCWREAQAGQGGLVLVSGEAGVGKTRLVEAFADRLRWQGVRVLWGRSYEFERSLPYQPAAEALRTALPALASDQLTSVPAWAIAEVGRLVPEVLERPVVGTDHPELSRQHGGSSGLEARAAGDLDQEQARLFAGVTRLLTELCSRRAVLLVLEDLHWASESTLQLLHYVACHLADQPVMMVATFRPEAVGPHYPLLALRRRLAREGLARPLRLSRLSREAVETMIVDMSGVSEAVVPLAERLYQETEGNPFFLMEIVKALFETGLIRLEEGAWHGDFARISEGELPLPASVSEAVRARVQRLDEKAQEGVRLAAVLGRAFDFEVLNAVWGRGEEATLEALDDLLRQRLIDESTDEADADYAFTHHKIQEVVYEELPRRRRQHLHGQVGAAMETLLGDDVGARAGKLGHHFERARGLDPSLATKAVRYLRLAGEQARQAYAYEDAIDYYRRALTHLEETPSGEVREDLERGVEIRLYEGLASALEMTGRRAEARDAYQSALIRVPKEDVIQRSHLYRRIGKSWEVLCYEEAARAYDMAESALGEEPTEHDLPWWRAWIEIRVDRMWLCYWQRRVDRMTELAQRARPAVEQYGKPVQRARFFQVLHMLALQQDRFRPSEETTADARAALSASREINDATMVAMSQFKLGFTHLFRDDLPEAEEALQTARSMAERTRDAALHARCLTYLTILCRKRGQINQVRDYARQSLEAAATAHMKLYVGCAKANLAWIAWREGDLSKARAEGRSALHLWQELETYPFYWLAVWPLVGVALTRQEVATAMEYVPMLLDPLQQRPPEDMETMLERALDAWDRYQTDAAQQHLQQAADLASRLGCL